MNLNKSLKTKTQYQNKKEKLQNLYKVKKIKFYKK